MKAGRNQTRAFTLLEMMLSIAVFLILITAAFTLTGGTAELIAEVSETEDDAAIKTRFVESCRYAFSQMDADSTLEFDYVDRGSGKFDTYLSLVNAPRAFSMRNDHDFELSRVVIAAEIQPDGFIRSGVYYFSEIEWERSKEKNFAEMEVPYLALVSGMRQLTWRFYDDRLKEWQDSRDRAFPCSLVELTIRTKRKSGPARSVFWFIENRT